jgi:hypothetical protein
MEKLNKQRRKELEPLCDVDGDIVERTAVRPSAAMVEEEVGLGLTPDQQFIQSIETLLIASKKQESVSSNSNISGSSDMDAKMTSRVYDDGDSVTVVRFEEIVEYLLEPALHLVQESSQLHIAFAFASIVTETLTTVSETFEVRLLS